MPLEITHSADIEALVQQLGASIDGHFHSGDRTIFDPITVVVPNSTMATWLKLRLAEQLGVVSGLEFPFLENHLWSMVVPEWRDPEPPIRLDSATLQRLILSWFMHADLKGDRVLRPVDAYIGNLEDAAPDVLRKAWQLAERLSRLFLEYEIQRVAMVEQWHKKSFSKTLPFPAEEWQQHIYYELFKSTGWRDKMLPRQLTLPQLRTSIDKLPRPGGSLPTYGFGIAHMAPFHLDLLCELGQHHNIQLFVVAPKWAKTPSKHALRQAWGVSATQNCDMIMEREANGLLTVLQATVIQPGTIDKSSERTPKATGDRLQFLNALQRSLASDSAPGRLPQDSSLQVWACPGRHREVETVFNLILARLSADASLRLNDIVVVVSDIDDYLPYLREVFSRHDRKIPFNLAGADASTTSLYASAVASLLNLVGSGFSRRECFVLLNNPCFLEAVGADPDMPRQWLAWADKLGIRHSYDLESKNTFCDGGLMPATAGRGYTPTPWSEAHTWLAALRRLRLGRIMDASPECPENDYPYAWHDLIPYSDLDSDGDSLDRFSYAIELLFRQCTALTEDSAVPASNTTAAAPATAKAALQSPGQWSDKLQKFLDSCLVVPVEHPREEAVRSRVYAAVRELTQLGLAFPDGISLDVARNHILESVTGIMANTGRPLLDGITITTPRLARLIPFRDVYFIGLGEGQFPGSVDRSIVDLRRNTKGEGDLTGPENNRQLFLDAVQAARERLVLTYSNCDVEKDAELGPCSLISQLESYCEREMQPTGTRFVEAVAPLHGRSLSYLAPADTTQPFDALINYDQLDYQLAEAVADKTKPVSTFKVQANPNAVATPAPTVITIRQLKDFLVNPAEAALMRRLGVSDDRIDETAEVEDEPFFSEFPHKLRLGSGVLERYLRQRMEKKNSVAIKPEDFFDKFYNDAHRRSHTPDGVFKELDQEAFRKAFLSSVDALGPTLDELATGDLCSISIGSSKNLAQGVHFPTLCIDVASGPVAVSGSLPLVWKVDGEIHALVLTDCKDMDELIRKVPKAAKESSKGSSHKPNGAEEDEASVQGGGTFTAQQQPSWRLVKHILEPLLVFTALQAGEDASGNGESSRDRVRGRKFVLHVSSRKDVQKLTFDITPDAAAEHLNVIVDACVNDAGFDDIPLFTICSRGRLWPVGASGDDVAYKSYLEEYIDDDESNPKCFFRSCPELLSLLGDGLQVPDDARQKVLERLMPFHEWRDL